VIGHVVIQESLSLCTAFRRAEVVRIVAEQSNVQAIPAIFGFGQQLLVDLIGGLGLARLIEELARFWRIEIVWLCASDFPEASSAATACWRAAAASPYRCSRW
jgi:hypothetical protein